MKYARKMHVIYFIIKIVMFLWCVNISISATIDDPNCKLSVLHFTGYLDNFFVVFYATNAYDFLENFNVFSNQNMHAMIAIMSEIFLFD